MYSRAQYVLHGHMEPHSGLLGRHSRAGGWSLLKASVEGSGSFSWATVS